MNFSDIKFKSRGKGLVDLGKRAEVIFPSGYSVSIVSDPRGFYEVALLFKGEMCYKELTGHDVLRLFQPADVLHFTKRVKTGSLNQGFKR